MTTTVQHRARLCVEALLALLSATASVLLLWRPDWMEATTGIAPDRGSGSLEALLAAGLLALTCAFVGLTFREARSLRRPSVSPGL
ncbi:MAG: hypothetical protein M0Z51_12645 [Propionibacterium sp.]|nr:hypothetical protein [Propionibacterium sp.]